MAKTYNLQFTLSKTRAAAALLCGYIAYKTIDLGVKAAYYYGRIVQYRNDHEEWPNNKDKEES